MDENDMGLSPEDEQVLEGISSGTIEGQHLITITAKMPRDDYERFLTEPPEVLEAWRKELEDKAFAALPDEFLASNERLRVELKVEPTES